MTDSRYVVAMGCDAKALAVESSRLMELGYVPHGPMIVIPAHRDPLMCMIDTEYLQPMLHGGGA